MEVINQRVKLGWDDERFVAVLEKSVIKRKKMILSEVNVTKLNDSMILADDLFNKRGTILLRSKGQEITKSFIYRLSNIEKNEGIRQPIKVIYPLDE